MNRPASASEPCDARAAPSSTAPASPWRFGMGGLLLLTGLCAGQFALVSYLGPWLGLLVGLLLGLAALGGLLIWAIASREPHDSPRLARWDRFAIRLTVGITLLLLVALFAGGGTAVYRFAAERHNVRRLERQLGFRSQTCQVIRGAHAVRAVEIVSVDSGGVLAQAGGQPRDVIVHDGTPREVFRMLRERRGSTLIVRVAHDARGRRLEDCRQRQLALPLPPP